MKEIEIFELTSKPISNTLLEIFMNFIDSEKSFIKPSLFIENFKNNHKKFNNKFHQDSQEFLRLLLDDLSIELNRNLTNPPYKEIDHFGKSKPFLNEEYFNMFLKREDSLLQIYFTVKSVILSHAHLVIFRPIPLRKSLTSPFTSMRTTR